MIGIIGWVFTTALSLAFLFWFKSLLTKWVSNCTVENAKERADVVLFLAAVGAVFTFFVIVHYILAAAAWILHAAVLAL